MGTDRISVAIIGAGAIAEKRHIPEFLANPQVDKVVIADQIRERVEAMARKFNIERYVWGDGSWKELVSDPTISAVAVCVSNKFHAPIAIEAARLGKHVLVEKPIAISVEEADQMIKTAEKAGVFLMVGHHRRFQGCYCLGKSILASGLLGKPKSIRVFLKQPGPVEWAPNSNWFYNNSAGGGVLLDLGIHMADVALWYLEKNPVKIQALLSDVGSFSESAVCLAQFEEGIIGTLDVSWGTFAAEKGVTVYCEKGKLIVDEYAANPVKMVLTDPVKTETIFPIPEVKLNSVGAPNLGVVDHFIGCVTGRIKPVVSAKEARNALAFVMMAQDSAMGKLL